MYLKSRKLKKTRTMLAAVGVLFFSNYKVSAANSMYSRIAGRQVPTPRSLSPAANSTYSRVAGRQVAKPRCLSPAADSLYSRTAGRHPKPGA